MRTEKVDRLPLSSNSLRYQSIVDKAYTMDSGDIIKIIPGKYDPSNDRCRRWVKKHLKGYKIKERQGEIYLVCE